MATTANPSVRPADDPSTQSSERVQVNDWVDLVRDVLDGAAAVRKRGHKYLPKFEGESQTEYDRRVQTASWRPEFADAHRTLSSKPFEEDVSLQGESVPEAVREFSEDVDGRGNNVTQFSSELFKQAVAYGMCVLFVDFPSMPAGVSRSEEIKRGARPYWSLVFAFDIVAMYTDYREGREVVVHLRWRETVKRRDGFAEKLVYRIRQYDDLGETGEWRVWELDENTRRWEVAIEDGVKLEGKLSRGSGKLTSIPAVPLFLGDREGELKTRPPLLDLADMQIELYRALSREDEVLTFAASPILTGNGLKPPGGRQGERPPAPITVGPKTVLYAPGENASWDYINPSSGNIEQIRKKSESIIQDMRRLGMQPLTPGSGTPTATGQSIEASKAHSAVKAWALRLKDALEQAYVYTCEWINQPPTVEVSVFTDFDVMPFAQAPLQALGSARSQGDLSQRTYWEGLRRFDVLNHEFDPEAEEQRLAEEQQGLEGEMDIDPITGQPVDGPVGDVDTDGMESYDDLSEEDLRALVGDDLVDQALAQQGGDRG